jgi:choline dehydrogenase
MSDYLIVGAGAAGCVLANRLSADPDCRVTVLEAGGPDRHFLYRMPAGYLRLMTTGMGNWKYDSSPQPGLHGRTMYFPRGKVVGGSTSINGLVAVRGNKDDYDGWSAAGNAGWSYEACLPYFRKLESFDGGEDRYRGIGGPIGITTAPVVERMTAISRAWIEGGLEAGYPYNPDINGESQEGFGRAQANFADSRRQSASAKYLEPVRARCNLGLITGALVTRILMNGRRAIGVEYLKDDRLEILQAEREVILCGGAINSPQVLQLSGIGNASHLEKLGIRVRHHLSGVGENLQDHIGTTLKQRITKPLSVLSGMKPLAMAAALARYFLFNSGPAISNGLEAWAFLKSRNGIKQPDLQYYCAMLMYDDHGRDILSDEGFMLYLNGSRPLSRGSVRIASTDPRKSPTIDPNYFQEYEDIRVLRNGLRMARDVISTSAFNDFRGAEHSPGIDVASDADLDAYIRHTSLSVYHPVGTCKMGSDEEAVVDDCLRVRGLERLRIVDASIMPTLVSGNTNLPTMMIAEKASDLITTRNTTS